MLQIVGLLCGFKYIDLVKQCLDEYMHGNLSGVEWSLLLWRDWNNAFNVMQSFEIESVSKNLLWNNLSIIFFFALTK